MAPARLRLPDIVSPCPFELRIHPRCKQAANSSDKWLDESKELNDKQRLILQGTKAGLLGAMCFPTVDFGQLRVCCDFINYQIHMDTLLSICDPQTTMAIADSVMQLLSDPQTPQPRTHLTRLTQSIWLRIRLVSRPHLQQRFLLAMEQYFQATCQQAEDRVDGIIPDLESYISLRRDSSGCKALFTLIEYAQGIELPAIVTEHPNIQALTEAANDLISWASDIFSYNSAQSRQNPHNLVVVLAQERGLSPQDALVAAGDLVHITLDAFLAQAAYLPAFGMRISADVEIFVRGLQDCIVGALHWSFETERFFGKSGSAVKMSRMVNMLSPLSS